MPRTYAGPIFAHRHYEAIAALVAALPDGVSRYDLSQRLTDMFRADNSQFKPDRFARAARTGYGNAALRELLGIAS